MNLIRIAIKISANININTSQHCLKDVIDGKYPVGVEGNSGRDILKAKQLGLFTCNVNGIDIYAKCEADARPLIHYLERGGEYGSEEFSRILGYSESEITEYGKKIIQDLV